MDLREIGLVTAPRVNQANLYVANTTVFCVFAEVSDLLDAHVYGGMQFFYHFRHVISHISNTESNLQR